MNKKLKGYARKRYRAVKHFIKLNNDGAELNSVASFIHGWNSCKNMLWKERSMIINTQPNNKTPQIHNIVVPDKDTLIIANIWLVGILLAPDIYTCAVCLFIGMCFGLAYLFGD